MKVDRDLVLQVARLARLELTEAETDLFAAQLQDVLEYVEKLQEVNEPPEPHNFGAWIDPVLREDIMRPSLDVVESQANAPDAVKRFFRVPRIIP